MPAQQNVIRWRVFSRNPQWFPFFLPGILAGLFLLANPCPSVAQQQKPPAGEKSTPTKKASVMDKQVLTKGQHLFQNNCSPCHNFLQKSIGPDLSAVTQEVSPEWIRKFIRNAPAMIRSGDARATQLFAEYKQAMPAFTSLSEADIQAIVSFIHSNQRQASAASENPDLGTPLLDPIPDKIASSGFRLSLEEVATAPPTAQKAPLARINQMRVLPGKTDRVFIEDLRGTLYEMIGDSLRIFMEMGKERPGFIHSPGHATGFGSYAFHPDFYANGLFYTTHTEKAHTATADFGYADSIRVALQWVLTEWKMTTPTSQVFAGTGRELLRIDMVTTMHGVQEITFNPHAQPGSPDYGLLYIGVGDGGAGENGYAFLCNTLSQVWSSVLRIDPLGSNSKNGRYGIPPGNPYARDQDAATLGEVFCRGFRNPNRICWTPDGKMLITDIGQSSAEELNLGLPGADYGWPEREGLFLINHRGKMNKVYALPENDPTFHYTYPVALYDHDEGNAFSGGFVYTGTDIPLLKGKYIFGDIVNGRVFCLESNQLQLGKPAPIAEMQIEVGGKVTTFQALTGNAKADLRFGVGLNNALYLYTKSDGKMYKLKRCSRL